MSTQAIRISAPPVVPPPTRPRKGIAIALLLSLGLHAIVILGLVDWFQDAPDSPSIVKATLARMSGPPAASSPAAEPLQAPPTAQSFSEPPATATDGATEATQRSVAIPVTTGQVESVTPESQDEPLDYAAAFRQIADAGTPYASEQPRVRRVVEGRTQTPEDAWYLESWRRKVKRIGALNYPDEARARKLYGSLLLLVSIEPDGTLRDVQVIDSSGHEVLDEAAVRIVRLAAPYAPFSPAMREETDVLEIVSTWQFKERGPASPS